MENKELFNNLGLTNNEGKVYSELVKHGKLSASEISSKSGAPYGKIYVILQGLIDKGLVQTIPDKTKKFVASSPESLIKLIDEKKKDLDEAKKKVSELKQFYDKKEKDFLIIGEGDKGFWKVASEMEYPKKESHSIMWKADIKPDTFKTMKKAIRNKLDTRTLVRYDKETKKDVDKRLKLNKNFRVFENEGVAMHVSDQGEVMIGLIKKNTTLLIRDTAFAKIIKKLFLAAYDKAERII